ncbi:MAG: hypothetical protein HQ481_00925 [Alphaproteobacteria bacterium]|nr:hypothetical protein [Alphaproteobacteria bacterium]
MSMPDRPIERRTCASLLGGGLVLALSFIAGIVGVPSAPGAAAERFVDGFEDLPLMPALEPVPEAAMAFDTAGGRIIVAAAEGRTTMEDVRTFYAATLPQLGWQRAGEDRWRREDEELTLEALGTSDGLIVRFQLAPH